MIDDAVDSLMRWIGAKKPDYPPLVLREAIANALTHRDYSPDARGTQVHISVFTDRIEITNPGGLYGMVTHDVLASPHPVTGAPFVSTRNQFLFTLLAGLVLGGRRGAIAGVAYILLGLLGVPIFAAGGGPGYVLQPTFGYLLGFVLQAWFCGKYARSLRTISFRSLLAVNVGGMAIVYILGIGWFYLVSNYVLQAPIAFWTAIFYCGILQVGPDFLLCMAAAGLALRCYKVGLWLAMPLGAERARMEVKEG